MKIIKDTLEPEFDSWDDPGDYPNALAGGPLPSYNYLSGVNGDLVVELNGDELNEFHECIDCESLNFWVSEVLQYPGPNGVIKLDYGLEKIESKPVCGCRKYTKYTHFVHLYVNNAQVDSDYYCNDNY